MSVALDPVTARKQLRCKPVEMKWQTVCAVAGCFTVALVMLWMITGVIVESKLSQLAKDIGPHLSSANYASRDTIQAKIKSGHASVSDTVVTGMFLSLIAWAVACAVLVAPRLINTVGADFFLSRLTFVREDGGEPDSADIPAGDPRPARDAASAATPEHDANAAGQ